MILSASRRTDIPNYYSEWFFNRIKEKYVYVRNPMNPHQVSKIDLSPDVIDCIVFWTKNPMPMLERLEELKGYNYYFQFTLTSYGADMECSVPHKREVMIPVFQKLSDEIGKEKVIWRYDPIIFTEKYTLEYHIKAFEQIASALKGYTEKCVISFVDTYAKNKKNMQRMGVEELRKEELTDFAGKLSEIATRHNIEIASCAENIDLENYGIKHNCCIDKELIERIIGCKINATKDKNQREECGCVESIEIGAYDTCKNGCKYCYANSSQENLVKNCNMYDAMSPILCGEITEEDRVSIRKVKSIKEVQMSIFDV